jgi:linoleoyl-CoA desaturase
VAGPAPTVIHDSSRLTVQHHGPVEPSSGQGARESFAETLGKATAAGDGGAGKLFVSAGVVLLYYGIAGLVTGIVLSVVFQVAHCVEDARFPVAGATSARIEHPWAVHQTETTVDFARPSRVVTWLVGGLNFQIEHHLFPRICHVNYPAISALVQETCRDFGIRYLEHRSLRAGLASHFRWLRRMGMPETTA